MNRFFICDRSNYKARQEMIFVFFIFLGFARDKKSFFRRPFFVVAVAMATAVFDVSHNAIKKITIIWFLACIKDYQSIHDA